MTTIVNLLIMHRMEIDYFDTVISMGFITRDIKWL